jgi:hypothetical protein
MPLHYKEEAFNYAFLHYLEDPVVNGRIVLKCILKRNIMGRRGLD